MVESKDCMMKRYKRKQKEKKERKKFESNNKSDDEYENYKKYESDPESNYVDSDNDSDHNERKYFNGKNNKGKNPLSNKKIKRTIKNQ